MWIYALQLSCLAICSCLQINLYTPFKSRIHGLVFGFVMILLAASFLWMNEGGFSLWPFVLNLLLAAAASDAGLLCCKTAVFCGIYNVVIQLCINDLILSCSITASLLLPVSAHLQTVIQMLLCMFLSGLWLFIMWRLRHAVWVYMPMPDRYYRGVMLLVCVDYLFILIGAFFPPVQKLILIFVCLVLVIAVLHVIRMPQFVIQERERTQMILYQQQAMQAYIDSYQQSEDHIRTLRHDIRHMVNTVSSLMDDHEYDKARELSRQMADWVEREGRPQYSSDPLINAILKDYTQRFAAADVSLEISVRLTSSVAISELDLTTLLHNVLSNALEYCSSPNRTTPMFTKLQVSTNRSYFILTCTNPLDSPLQYRGEKILSTKEEDKMLHGIGLESVKTIARRYDGEMEIFTDNDHFRVSVMLLNSPIEEE